MAKGSRKYKTHAHFCARHGLFRCAKCSRYLRNAKYEGEFVYAYDANGSEKMASVYMRCRCGTLNAASMDVTGVDDLGFYNHVEGTNKVPNRAKRITEPAMAEENAAI